MLSLQFSLWFVLAIFTLVSTSDFQPWEAFLNKDPVERPLGLIVNKTLLVHQHFVVGYTCLHTFLYEHAQDAFSLAIETDPTFVEAHIRRLFGHKYALWSHTDRTGALQVWTDSWKTFNKHHITLTPVQSAYFNAFFQYFAYENVRDGEKAFLTSMLDLTRQYPLDNDAQVLLGLAYLNEAYQEHSKVQTTETPTMLQARKILQAAIENEPSHPGGLHYLIHALDVSYTEIAVRAVPYANKIQEANVRSVQNSLMLCIIKNSELSTENGRTYKTSTLTLAHLLTQFDVHQSHILLSCDKFNRIHAQDWLVYAYIQRGRYDASVAVLSDFLLLYNASSSDRYYLPLIYRARAFIVIETFFWLMYNKEKNREQFLLSIDEIGLGTDSSSIEHVDDVLSECLLRFAACLRLLMVKKTDKSATEAFNHHLARMIRLASDKDPISIRIGILVLQVKALRWCFDEEFEKCLMKLATATEIESCRVKDFEGPELVYIRSAELYAFYLLISHRYYSRFSSAYNRYHSSIPITNFPSIAFDLYEKANKTAPFRGSNMLGMARAQVQMGHKNEAIQLYERLLHDWSHSLSSSSIDQIVIQEAIHYIHQKHA